MEAILNFDLEPIAKILASVFAVALAISKIHIDLSSQNYKRVELYQQLQKLCGADANTNLSEILVILRLFTRAHLTNKEIEWFIWTPGAFRYLQEYGKKIEFIDIDYEKDAFKWREKFNSGWSRFGRFISLSFFYSITGVAGAILYQLAYKYFSLENVLMMIIPIIMFIAGSACLIKAYRLLNKVLILLPREFLVSANLRGDRMEEHSNFVPVKNKENTRRYIHL
ncbi:hypothetical protein [Pseudoalteromonas sp. T1lg88]|uniref:hypothetical protein n=1 Tax=Pseudoalteromonas sp. T1lg88 TaxID=2077104 RepID=UPI000CF5F1B3|nr:hypothetical protein [Pseudoalteromonas sp. T1lg88]